MFENSNVRVPNGSTVTVHTPQPGWTGPGIVVAVVVLVVLGAIRGNPDARPATPRDVSIAQPEGIALFTEPNADSPKLADLAVGRTVEVLCHTDGPESVGWGGSSRIWDRVSIDGLTGYVPDTAVNTHVTVDKIADPC